MGEFKKRVVARACFRGAGVGHMLRRDRVAGVSSKCADEVDGCSGRVCGAAVHAEALVDGI